MINFTKTHPKNLSSVLIAAGWLMIAAHIHAAGPNGQNLTSKLFVADTEGVSSINTGNRIIDLIPKAVHAAEGVILETQSHSSNTLVLSNGTGLSLSPDTSLQVTRFQQAPFSPNRTDLESEPSISQIQALLTRGSVGICTSKLLAGSTMSFKTRQADIIVHGGKLLLETDDTKTIVSLIEGDELTIRDDLNGGWVILKAGDQAVITRISATTPSVIRTQLIPDGSIGTIKDTVTLASMARRTVYFEVADPKTKNSSANNTGSVFNRTENEEDTLVPVTVLPGTIPVANTVSPFRITRTGIQ